MPSRFLSPEWTAYGQSGFLGWVNSLIESRPDLHQACQPLAGRRLCFVLDPLGLEASQLKVFTAFEADGLLGTFSLDALANPEPEVTIHLGPSFFVETASTGLAQFAASFLPTGGSEQAASTAGPSLKGVSIQGDAALAQKLMPLIQSLKDHAPQGPAFFRLLKPRFGQADQDPSTLPFVSKADLRQQAARLRTLREGIDRLSKRLKAAPNA